MWRAIRANDGRMDVTARAQGAGKRGGKSRYEGIALRHARGCRSRSDGRCSCTPTYQAQVWSAREQKTIRKTFPTLAAARSWRHESQVALRKGTLRSTSHLTLAEAAEAWLSAAEAGLVRTRTGEAYKPSGRGRAVLVGKNETRGGDRLQNECFAPVLDNKNPAQLLRGFREERIKGLEPSAFYMAGAGSPCVAGSSHARAFSSATRSGGNGAGDPRSPDPRAPSGAPRRTGRSLQPPRPTSGRVD